MKQILLLLLLALVVTGCSDDRGELVDQVENESETNPGLSMEAPGDDLPPGHPPVDSSATNPQAVLVPGPDLDPPRIDGTTVQAAGLTFDVDPLWSAETPASRMRAAQFALPAADGDEQGGELVLFAGFMGPVDQNIQRWIGQIQNPVAEPIVETATIGDFTVTKLDVTGTYATTMGGAPMLGGDPVQMPGYRMLAAVIQRGDDFWYWKLTGPRNTLEQWKSSFDAMLESMK